VRDSQHDGGAGYIEQIDHRDDPYKNEDPRSVVHPARILALEEHWYGVCESLVGSDTGIDLIEGERREIQVRDGNLMSRNECGNDDVLAAVRESIDVMGKHRPDVEGG
jgi:hypothetical protein